MTLGKKFPAGFPPTQWSEAPKPKLPKPAKPEKPKNEVVDTMNFSGEQDQNLDASKRAGRRVIKKIHQPKTNFGGQIGPKYVKK